MHKVQLSVRLFGDVKIFGKPRSEKRLHRLSYLNVGSYNHPERKCQIIYIFSRTEIKTDEICKLCGICLLTKDNVGRRKGQLEQKR